MKPARDFNVKIKHGHAAGGKRSTEYVAYKNARSRCVNPNNVNFKWYGSRGIEFRFDSFKQFILHIGKKPDPHLTLDRIDTNGHYEIGNVRWATPAQQVQNSNHNVLSRESVSWIRSCGLPIVEMARTLGASAKAVSRARSMKSWK